MGVTEFIWELSCCHGSLLRQNIEHILLSNNWCLVWYHNISFRWYSFVVTTLVIKRSLKVVKLVPATLISMWMHLIIYAKREHWSLEAQNSRAACWFCVAHTHCILTREPLKSFSPRTISLKDLKGTIGGSLTSLNRKISVKINRCLPEIKA